MNGATNTHALEAVKYEDDVDRPYTYDVPLSDVQGVSAYVVTVKSNGNDPAPLVYIHSSDPSEDPVVLREDAERTPLSTKLVTGIRSGKRILVHVWPALDRQQITVLCRPRRSAAPSKNRFDPYTRRSAVHGRMQNNSSSNNSSSNEDDSDGVPSGFFAKLWHYEKNIFTSPMPEHVRERATVKTALVTGGLSLATAMLAPFM